MSDLMDSNPALQRIVAKGRLTRADARAALGLPPDSEAEEIRGNGEEGKRERRERKDSVLPFPPLPLSPVPLVLEKEAADVQSG